jgi:hypothetical protein
MSAPVDFKNGALIGQWLKDMGYVPKFIADPLAGWAFEISCPQGSPQPLGVRVGSPKNQPRAVVVGVRMAAQPPHIAAFANLEEDIKREFWRDLRAKLNREFVEFAVEGTPETGCPVAFRVTATRFDDGLSLDSLHRTILSVVKACLDGIALFAERLGTAGPASGGGEFAFRKIGIQ